MKHGQIPISTVLYLPSDVDALLAAKAPAADVLALQGQVATLQASAPDTAAKILALQMIVATMPLGSAATHPATDFALSTDSRLTNARTPVYHAATHAPGSVDPISPAMIGAATAAQGAKADSALQLLPGATLTYVGGVKKAAALTNVKPSLLVPTVLTGAVSLATVQLMQNRFEELVTVLQAAGHLA